MNTLFLLIAKHDGQAMLSADVVCREYFAPLSLPTFMRKVSAGNIPVPLLKKERSQKGARLVHLQDLPDYIDRQRVEAKRELKKMTSLSYQILHEKR